VHEQRRPDSRLRTPRRLPECGSIAGDVSGRAELAPQYRRRRGPLNDAMLAFQRFLPATQLLAKHMIDQKGIGGRLAGDQCLSVNRTQQLRPARHIVVVAGIGLGQ
jgi:hypothetical protein